MQQATLHIMCGLPYSGKSTLTQILVERYDLEIVSMDQVMEENSMDSDTMTQEDWDFVYSEGYRRLNEYLKVGKNIVLDLGNLKRSERNTARAIAEEAGAKFKLIYINTPVSKIWDRWKENETTKVRGQLSKKSLDYAISIWEEPSSDEHPIIYNHTMNIDKWMSDNIEIS